MQHGMRCKSVIPDQLWVAIGWNAANRSADGTTRCEPADLDSQRKQGHSRLHIQQEGTVLHAEPVLDVDNRLGDGCGAAGIGCKPADTSTRACDCLQG